MGESMQLKENWLEPCTGKIRAEWFNLKTGEYTPLVSKDNIIVYRAADIMARIIAGDVSYIPQYIGYIYAPNTVTMTNPSATRLHTWESIEAEVEAVAGNMILSSLESNPSFAIDGDPANYEGNAVTVSALSDANATRVFTGAGFAADNPQAGTDAYFQAVLLSRIFTPGSITPTYIPYARTQFTAGDTGVDVQAGLELAVYWTLSFK